MSAVPQDLDQEIFLAIKSALATAKAAYDHEAVAQHQRFLEIEEHLEGIDNEFHLRGRLKKYAEAFKPIFDESGVMTSSMQKALEIVRASEEEQTEAPKEKRNGTEKPKRSTEPAPDESKDVTPQEKPQEHPNEKPDVAGAIRTDDSGIDWKALQRPFDYSEIEWRIGNTSEQTMKGSALPYITNRAVQDRLDEVVGCANWKNQYIPGANGGVMCGISIRVNGEWITKWDGADNTNFEGVKGGLSDSMKRAAVQWGMGRYLYKAKIFWYDVEKAGKSYRFKDRNLQFKLEFES